MYCTKCGAQNASGSRFCGRCGAPLGSADNVYGAPQQSGAYAGNAYGGPQQSAAPAGNVYGASYQPGYAGTPRPARPAAPSGSGKGKLIAIGAAALVVVTLLACWIFGVFGGGYEKVVDNFIESIFDADAKGVVDCLPDEVIEVIMEDEGCTKRELIEELQYGLDEIFEYMPSGLKISHKILYTEDIYGDDLRYLKEDYEEIGVKVTAAKIVEVEMTVSAMGMSETETFELGVVEIGSSWYIDVESMEDMLDDLM